MQFILTGQFITTGIPVGLTTAALGAILYFTSSKKKIAEVVYDIGLGVTVLTLAWILFRYFSHL